MIRDFVQWTASFGETGDLEELRNCRVGIEAAEYLSQRILKHPRAREPLIPALGGLPLALEQHIQEDLHTFRSLEIEPYFVFSGLDITKQGDPFSQKVVQATVNADAWTLYDNHEAEASVAKFGESKYVTPEDLFRALQSILTKQKVYWTVAPYSAWAQLAYLEKNEYVHAVFGSSDIFLFECSRLITSWDFEARQFSFVRRERCVADLSKFTGGSNITDNMFLDTCILAGTPFMETLPVLGAPIRADLLKPHSAIRMIIGTGQSGYSVVTSNQDVPPSGKEYVTRYQKARLAIKNHPVLTQEGNIEPLSLSEMPNDAHEYLGRRLPDEMLYYMSKGVINPRILQWRTTCEVFEVPPMDGGESQEYKNLVSTKIMPLRTLVVNLLSSTLNKWYGHSDLKQTNWFSSTDPNKKTNIPVEKPMENPTPSIVSAWNVKEATFNDVVAQHKNCGPLGSAILSLQNTDFVSKTVAKKDTKNLLSSNSEILYNSIWRFLSLREYVDSSHNLTQWGKVLAAVITGLKGKPEYEEAAVLAVELIRMGLLTADINMFPIYNGAPMRGSNQDKNSNMLVSRVAGLGILHHNPIGFTGPLSQHLLGYNSIINVVRQTLRDLVEVAATQMFLTGCCNRHTEISSIAMRLPFLLPNNCALSIAVKSYLDDLLNDPNPTAAETKVRIVENAATRYFPQSTDYPGDLRTAFELWDAVYAGIKNGPMPEATQQLWMDTNQWLAARR